MEETHATIELTDATFTSEVKTFSGIVLVDFWAEWCGPCRVMSPRIEELAQKYAGNPMVKVAALDVDANQETSMEYRVMSLPTFKVFRSGQVVDEMIGSAPVTELENMIIRLLPKEAAAA